MTLTCQSCPQGYITAGTNSTDVAQCTVGRLNLDVYVHKAFVELSGINLCKLLVSVHLSVI